MAESIHMLIMLTSLQVQFKWYLDDLQTFDGVTNAEDEKSSVLELKGLGKASNGKV